MKEKNEEQIRRISRMEEILDKARDIYQKLDGALTEFEAIRADVQELFDYYGSGVWQKDYEDDEAGRIPRDLKRGVLSQDAVYDLMSDHHELKETMRRLSSEEEEDE